MNKTSENMTYLIDEKISPCKHNKLHPLTTRRGKWISETMYKEINNIIQHDSQKYITSEGVEDLSDHKLTHCNIDYDISCCSYCTKSLCLEIKKKMCDLDKWYNLVKNLNMKNEKCKILVVFQLISSEN